MVEDSLTLRVYCKTREGDRGIRQCLFKGDDDCVDEKKKT